MENIKTIIESAETISDEAIFGALDWSIVSDSRLSPPHLPVDVFNDEWREIILTSAEVKGCPVDYVAAAMLAAVSGLIGASRKVSAWGSWKQYPLLWFMLVGDPSTNKSPSLQTITDALESIEKELLVPYQKALAEYETQQKIAEKYLEKWEKDCRTALRTNQPVPAKPKQAESLKPPARPRLIINDVTIEKVVHIILDNPKGLLLIKDELSEWIANMTRRGGSDLEFYLPAYDGGSRHVDRVKYDNPLIVDILAITIIGGIQPEKLDRLVLNKDNDGFAARFLPIWPHSVPFKRPQSSFMFEHIREAFAKLQKLTLQMREDGRLVSVTIPLSEKGDNLLAEWRARQSEREYTAEGVLKAYLGKLPGVILRLSLILAYMDWALKNPSKEPESINALYVQSAIRFVDEYFIPMGRRTYADAALPREQKDARLIAKWLQQNRTECLNVRVFSRAAGSPLRDAARIKAALNVLIECGWLAHVQNENGSSGRKRGDYLVNPLLYTAP
jgi:hypothetical protein